MKKERTSSYFTWICEKNNKKFVRCYKRSNKTLHGYPRIVPINKILKLVKFTDINYPKVLFNSLKYIDIEYIYGIDVTSDIDNKFIIKIIIDYIEQLTLVDCHKIEKYISWNNNTEYLMWLINHILKVFDSKSYLKDVYDKLYIDKQMISKYLNYKLDDNRKLSLIHGDLHRGNMILKDDNIYLLDWELATKGDLAYELAIHFILMNYMDEEKQFMVSELCKIKNYNLDTLKNDIKIYYICEYFRRTVMRISKLIELVKNNTDYKELLKIAYHEYCQLMLYSNIQNKYSITEFEKIILNEKSLQK